MCRKLHEKERSLPKDGPGKTRGKREVMEARVRQEQPLLLSFFNKNLVKIDRLNMENNDQFATLQSFFPRTPLAHYVCTSTYSMCKNRGPC